MEGIEMFIEHLSGLTQGVFWVEIENVADTIEYEGGDLTLSIFGIRHCLLLNCKFTRWFRGAFVLWLLDEFAPLSRAEVFQVALPFSDELRATCDPASKPDPI